MELLFLYLLLTALVFSHLHVNCNSFISTLPFVDSNLQYIETNVDKREEAKIIIATYTDEPDRPKPLYHAFDETEVSSINNFNGYVRRDCLGSELIQRLNSKKDFKSKKFVPLSQRTKTLEDLKSPVNEIDDIDVNNIRYKQDL